MPIYVYDCPACGQKEELRPMADLGLPCSTCGNSMKRIVAPVSIIDGLNGFMSGDEVRRRGMHEMLMDNKKFCESEKGRAIIREGGIEMRGPKEYHPVIPKEFH